MATPRRRIAPIIERVDRLSPAVAVALAGILGVLVVAADVATGDEISFSVFYVLPVALITWRFGRIPGLIVALAAAAAWFTVEVVGDRVYSQSVIPLWNGIVRCAFFMIIAELIIGLRDSLRDRSHEAQIDGLTGLLNRRGFVERADLELRRAERTRRALTIAYFDLDQFKQLNDASGHAAGDQLLRRVASTLFGMLRSVDVVGRIGGDEFAIVLPETAEAHARIVIGRLHARLREIGDDSGVGVSIGVLTFDPPPTDIEAALARADELMYDVKHSERGAVRYRAEAGSL